MILELGRVLVPYACAGIASSVSRHLSLSEHKRPSADWAGDLSFNSQRGTRYRDKKVVQVRRRGGLG